LIVYWYDSSSYPVWAELEQVSLYTPITLLDCEYSLINSKVKRKHVHYDMLYVQALQT